MRKYLGLAVAAGLAVRSRHGAAAEKLKIGFLPGVVDPFYQVMQLGVEKAAKDIGVEVVTQIPPTWGVEAQTPLLDSMVARGDLNYIITAADDKDQMIGPLKAAVDAGIKVIIVDTFLGDGDYAKARSNSRSAISARITPRAAASRRADWPRRSAAREPFTSTRPIPT